MTYFDEMRPCLSPFGRLPASIIAYLHGRSVCKAMSGTLLVRAIMSHGGCHAQVKSSQVLNIKKARRFRVGLVLYKSLAVTYFHMGTPTLSSALSCFTSVFGMGTGGANSLWPPGITWCLLYRQANSGSKGFVAYAHPTYLGLYGQASRAISIG